MLRVDQAITRKLEEKMAEVREMLEDPIEAKDAAKTFYWGFEDEMFSEAIRCDLIANALEESDPIGASGFRSQAREIRGFLADPDGYVRNADEGETCYCGGHADEVGRCEECGEWLW
jgi:hypothetical protein